MYNYVLHAIIVYLLFFSSLIFKQDLVKWAKEDIEHYADMFRRQVYSLNDQDEQTVEKCLRYARQHCSIVSHRWWCWTIVMFHTVNTVTFITLTYLVYIIAHGCRFGSQIPFGDFITTIQVHLLGWVERYQIES